MEESRRTRMTKRLMKDALMELMAEKPFAKISVSAICETADVNRSTFYAYYEDTYQLLQEVENDVFDKMPALKPMIEVTDRTNIHKNKEFIKQSAAFFEYIQKNAEMFRILLVESKDADFQRRLILKLQELYRWEDNSQADSFNHYRYIYIATGAVGMLTEWIRQEFPCSAKEFAQLLVDVIRG